MPTQVEVVHICFLPVCVQTRTECRSSEAHKIWWKRLVGSDRRVS